MIKELTKKDRLLENVQQHHFSNEPQFVQELREQAKKSFAELELPTSKSEYWKYTRLGKIVNNTYTVGENKTIDPVELSNYLIPLNDNEILIVVVNGFYNASLSKIEPLTGIRIHSLRDSFTAPDDVIENHLGKLAKSENELFVALNTTSFTDGVYLNIEKNSNIENPIHIVNVITDNNTITNTRTLVKANDNSSLKIVESFVNLNGKGTKSFTNHVSEFFIEPNAQVEYNKIQNKEGESYQITTEQVHQASNSNFTINTITLQGTLVRNNLNIQVDSENCETNLNGIYLGKDNHHIDNHTVVDHLKPNCNSNEVYKGILDNNAVGVFNGKVFVRPHAQKTNAFQENSNILLTDNAVINSKPELEIYADDVKCSHGSTTGQLDDEAIFYLQARGISKEKAIQLMVIAFVKDALNNISIAPLKHYIEDKINERFES